MLRNAFDDGYEFDMRFENDFMSFDDMFMKWCFEICLHEFYKKLICLKDYVKNMMFNIAWVC
jgi:hypothetical protein